MAMTMASRTRNNNNGESLISTLASLAVVWLVVFARKTH